jgi:hypothetical protein
VPGSDIGVEKSEEDTGSAVYHVSQFSNKFYGIPVTQVSKNMIVATLH